VYETSPVGFADQENFYNAAVRIVTTLSPRELLHVCIDVIERRAGRIRTVQDGPRTLDIDILLYGDEAISEDSLAIPHPRMNERAFVMVPLSEIAPEVVGDLGSYAFVDDVSAVKRLDLDFDRLLDSYKAFE
jgi:2-amino-4-hydroxy-6-hydroxymethyldihydropteridine diphosphokinase